MLLGIEFEETDDGLYIHHSLIKFCSLYFKYKFPISSLPMPKGLVLSKMDSPTNQCTNDEMFKLSL